MHQRIPIRCWVALVYFDSHHVKRYVPGRALDMSGDGLSVETIAPLEVGSIVYVRSKKVTLIAGTACVRHCGKRGFKYRMGLQYRTSFKNRF
ncbi:MAG TPA: PilZ domain-containing protein [Candidatus Acidoferrum sp.]|nr:PilZ domain-containing protein [Candidatus Acidoferrum sp.]